MWAYSKISSFKSSIILVSRCLALLQEQRITNLYCGLGCGSGLSGETISENGHHWIGLDISASMLSKFILCERFLVIPCLL